MNSLPIVKLEALEKRCDELEKSLSDPKVIGSPQFQFLTRDHKTVSEVVSKYREYKRLLIVIAETETVLQEGDREMAQLAKEELEGLKGEEEAMIEVLQQLLVPRDPNDDKNTLVEIRGGTGGEEAALFAADLFRMYTKYVERQRWAWEAMNTSPTELGGFKEVVFLVTGKGAYRRLKHESGVHRVQRVPTTEASGRIHTSAATVAVLPEAEEVDLVIDPKELRVDTFCSSGPGGQSVNTTYSAVRITHIPTGMVVSCQDERSQIKNKARALKVLRSRLLEQKQEEQERKTAAKRKSQVKSGDRSEKIRTYNFPQNRVTDHRVDLSLHNLDRILEGELDGLIDALLLDEQQRKLAAEGEGK
jgi:peptide chain release factor 1